MKNAVLVICVFIAFVVGYALGSKRPKPREITIQLRSDVAKPLPVLEPNDVVHWLMPDGQTKMTVTFPSIPGSVPCQEGASTTDCTVNKDRGLYLYHCDKCGDPVVPVGRSNGLNFADRLKGGAFYVPLGVYATVSNNSCSTAVPDQIAHVGDQFDWVPAGTDPPTSWTATFTGTNICGPAVFGSGTSAGGTPLPTTCTVTGPAGTYPYTADSSTPTGKCSSFQAKLIVQ